MKVFVCVIVLWSAVITKWANGTSPGPYPSPGNTKSVGEYIDVTATGRNGIEASTATGSLKASTATTPTENTTATVSLKASKATTSEDTTAAVSSEASIATVSLKASTATTPTENTTATVSLKASKATTSEDTTAAVSSEASIAKVSLKASKATTSETSTATVSLKSSTATTPTENTTATVSLKASKATSSEDTTTAVSSEASIAKVSLKASKATTSETSTATVSLKSSTATTPTENTTTTVSLKASKATTSEDSTTAVSSEASIATVSLKASKATTSEASTAKVSLKASKAKTPSEAERRSSDEVSSTAIYPKETSESPRIHQERYISRGMLSKQQILSRNSFSKNEVESTEDSSFLTDNTLGESSAPTSFPTTTPISILVVSIDEITDRNLKISWDPHIPDSIYSVILSAGRPNHDIPSDCSETPSEPIKDTIQGDSYNFSNILPDYIYDINVSTTIDNQIISGSQNVTTDTAAPGKPRNISLDCGDATCETKVVKWQMPCDPNGEISHYVIKYKGIYMLNNEMIEDSVINNTTRLEFSMGKLLPLTNYTLNVTAVGKNGQQGTPATYTFITNDTIPEAPIVSIDQLSSSGFRVLWKLQQLGNITKFRLNINFLGAAFSQNPNCSGSQTGKIIYEKYTGVEDDLSFLFQEALPFHTYNVSVVAVSSRTEGDAGFQMVVTNSSVPEPPEAVHLDFNALGPANLSWQLPCNINGIMDHTSVVISGQYTEDITDTDKIEKKIKFIDQRWYYEYTNITLRESFDYKVNLTIVLKDGTEGNSYVIDGTTPAGIPGKPVNFRNTSLSGSSFSMAWDPPVEHKGRLVAYEMNITSGEPLYFIPPSCRSPDPVSDRNIVDGWTTEFTFTEASAFYEYDITLRAATVTAFGDHIPYSLSTTQSVPESVIGLDHRVSPEKTETYNATVAISFRRPCFTNGPLRRFELSYTGTRNAHHQITDGETRQIQESETAENFTFQFKLEPEYEYTYRVTLQNDYFYSEAANGTFVSPSGVPIFSLPIDYLPIGNVGTEKAEIVLRRDLFNHTNGNINYVGLIVATKNVTGEEFQEWDGKNWPTFNDTEFLQITPNFWNPFKETTMDTVTFQIGNDTECPSQDYCNKPLEPNKEYYLIVRIFTNDFYKNSPTFKFQTEKLSAIGMIVGTIFGILGFAMIGVAALFIWRRGYVHNCRGNNFFSQIEIILRRASEKSTESKTSSVPCGKFVKYCDHLENNPEKLKEQYNLVVEKAKRIVAESSTEFAILPENKRKNRYINISPFDDTRVKLLIDEDDEIGSDYINASYVKGFTSQIEYIATQGPLETTCRDFWKMVLQENVTIIVMLTQFTENDKIKCHHYFPNNHENMIISDDMEVRCATELHFGTYCVRNLQIRKDTSQVTVTHMQFLDWPDYGVPVGTENMLQFCYQLRERVKIEGGIILVHCSAGVGRTGTLIATDILLQCVNAGKQIDVFNTVLELRKQRIFMVQTEKQYIYIHNLLKDFLERPPSPDQIENEDPVYENMDIMKQSEANDPKWKEQESEF